MSSPGNEDDLDQAEAESPKQAPPAAADDGLKPSAMRGSEALYGAGVVAILVVVAALNFVVRHGTGAPKHFQTGLAALGLLAALAVVPTLLTRNRFIVPLAAVVAAFFVTLPKGPASLQSIHVLAIIFPLVYALLLTQRQRKLATARARAARSDPSRTREKGRNSGKDKTPTPVGPRPSRRYTPPKSKRTRR